MIPIIARLSIALLLTSEYFNNGEASMKHVVSVSHVVATYERYVMTSLERRMGSTKLTNRLKQLQQTPAIIFCQKVTAKDDRGGYSIFLYM